MGLECGQTSFLDCISIPRCRICGARSTGVHYGVVSCEGCKAFYKRGVKNSIKHKCYFGSKCTMTSKTRGRCKACRFRRCEEEGMSVQAMRQGRKTKNDTTESPKSDIPDSPRQFVTMAALNSPRNNEVVTESITPRCELKATEVLSECLWIKELYELRRQMNSPTSDDLSSPAATLQSSPPSSIVRRASGDDIFHTSSKVAALDDLNNSSSSPRLNYFSGTMAQEAFPPFDVDELFSGGTVEQPFFMRAYMKLVCQRNSMLKASVAAVHKAVIKTVCDLDRRFRLQLPQSQILHHTSTGFAETVRTEVQFWATNLRLFALEIPGFSDLDNESQQCLLSERHVVFWGFFHSEFLADKKWCLQIPLLHCKSMLRSYYFQWVCEDEYVDFVIKLCVRLEALRLNIVEKFLLLVVLLFDPETASVKDRTYLAVIHAHYMDALMHVIATRTGERDILPKIEQMWPIFKLFHEVIKRYLLKLDSAEMPMKLKSGKRFCDVIRFDEQLFV